MSNDIRQEGGIWAVHVFIPVKGFVEIHIGDVHVRPLCVGSE